MVSAAHTRDTAEAMLLQESQIPLRNHEHGRDPSPTDEARVIGEVPLTSAARQALEEELARLRDVRQREIPARLRTAREFGDTANNDEHLAIREEEAVLAARIARLEDILLRATVVDHSDTDNSVVIGSQVSVMDVETGETLEYVIDGAHGAVEPGTVSALSPVGQALLGRSPGEQVSRRAASRTATQAKAARGARLALVITRGVTSVGSGIKHPASPSCDQRVWRSREHRQR
jgi:transcription elongation factor GreA